MRDITLENGPTVSAQLMKSGKPRSIGETGRIGTLGTGTLTLLVNVPRKFEGGTLIGAKLVDQGGLQMTRAYEYLYNNEEFRLSVSMEVQESEMGDPYTEHPHNAVRVLYVTPEGKVRAWMIAVVAQEGVFWVKDAQIYNAQAYIDGRKVVVPSIRRKGIEKLVRDAVNRKTDSFPGVAKLSPTNGKSTQEIPDDPDKGIVKFFSLGNQMAFIATKRGTVRAHWSALPPNGDGFRSVKSGAQVELENVHRPHDTRTRIPWEAERVHVVS